MPEEKGLVNVSTGESLKDKPMVEITELFRKITENGCFGSNERRIPLRKQAGLMEIDARTNMGAQLAVLNHKMSLMKARLGGKASLVLWLVSRGDHTDQCQLTMEQANFVNDYGRPRAYNPNWGTRPQ